MFNANKFIIVNTNFINLMQNSKYNPSFWTYLD